MKEWFKKHFCFHKWEHINTETIRSIKTEPPYFMVVYHCNKCGKTKYKCIYP